MRNAEQRTIYERVTEPIGEREKFVPDFSNLEKSSKKSAKEIFWATQTYKSEKTRFGNYSDEGGRSI
ncbi:MAG: hypothetical protein PVJ67_00880 [Candidatus Pacearchaeota archaeon]|jgi:hypothetical protein